MKKLIIAISFITLISACGNKRKVFEVSGKITNSVSRKVCLQYLVWGAERPIVVDSNSLQKDGSFILSTAYGKEESLYELVIQDAPSVLLINDNEKVFLNLDLNNYKNYITNGSDASASLHMFLNSYSTEYPKLVGLIQQFDTIQNKPISDSIKTVVRLEKENQLQKVNGIITTAFKNTTSPALQYYLTAKAFATLPLPQIQQLNTVAINQHPNHSGLAFLKSVIIKQMTIANEKQKVIELADLKRKKDSIKTSLDTLKKIPIDSLKK